ncbi:hypothetical protein FRC12_023208 [Ceratobasidium sp. 428]|nr:hypothetical protein FRC12_023208 [Ceratobasidium sp. 428]
MTEGNPKESKSRLSLSDGRRPSGKPKPDRHSTVDRPPTELADTNSSKTVHSPSSKHRSSTSTSHYYKSSTRPVSKLLVEPASDLSPDIKLSRVLQGETHVISYPGTSQYSQGAPSACGLAALNAIRLAFDMPLQGASGLQLVKWLATHDAHLVSVLQAYHFEIDIHLD